MIAHRKSMRVALRVALLFTSVGSLVKAASAITIDQLAGPWQVTLVGITGCGATSMEFTGTLNASGTATGTLSLTGGVCPLGSSAQTFTINSLKADGSGTAGLSCGSGCGWNFDIQVAGDTQTFILVDVRNGSANVLAGTGVKQVGSGITIGQLAGPWEIALVGNTGCGASSMEFTGTLNAGGTATGILWGGGSGCPLSSSAQTFTINSLNPDGSGTAGLSCGSGCGWNFDIQVAGDTQTFNLVDVKNGSANVLAGTGVKQVGSGITNDQLAGPWRIALVGTTGCGASSMEFAGTLNASGTATGTLSVTGGGCPLSSSAQTFTINPLNPDGSGTASLSCGPGCRWDFDIHVAANKQIFDLVNSVLAGTAVTVTPGAIVPDLFQDSPSEARAAVQAEGLFLKLSGSGPLVCHQIPGAGTVVNVGSTVTGFLGNCNF